MANFIGTKPTVSFFTNCYENDWERVLTGNRLQTMIQRCDTNFLEKILIINNVKDRAKVQQYADAAVRKNIIDDYYFAEDHSDAILKKYDISRDSFKLDFYDGYWYSMGPLAATYFCKGEYLLYFTCDCMMQEGATSDWIWESILEFRKNRFVFVANPYWDNDTYPAQFGNFKVGEKFYYTTGFSDQCFLIDNSRLQGHIYNCYHYSSEKFPKYAGELFEKRVYSYMCENGFVRISRNDVYYIHEKLLNEGLADEQKSRDFKKVMRRMASNWSRKVRKAILRRLLGHTKKLNYAHFDGGYVDTPVVPMEVSLLAS
jgi:hypothetical protein